jgi:signal transduction histidine kinase
MSAAAVTESTVLGERPSGGARLLRRMFSAEPWVTAAFMILSFVLGLFWFCLLIPLLAAGFGTLITLLGAPILALSLVIWIAGAKSERWRVRVFLGTTIPNPYHPLPDGSLWAKLKVRLGDGATWKDLAYLILLFPVGTAEFVVTVAFVAATFMHLTIPAWYWATSDDWSLYGTGWRVETLPEALLVAALGIPAFLLTTLVLIGMGRAHVALAQSLLGRNREKELEERVSTLTESRSRVMDAVAEERRRIERDLHDGAQQRLVALAMDLGMAKEKLDTDPASARTLVEEAHDQAKRALSEMRDLVRGIHPAVLTDRGLDAAISALAGRSPVPVSVEVDLPKRLPEAVETNAYFVVAEALANVGKHSLATRARVIVRCEGNSLVIEVADDGVGGADPEKGTGLAGLRDRMAALDGKLLVSSPAGGPTWIRAELPCGS